MFTFTKAFMHPKHCCILLVALLISASNSLYSSDAKEKTYASVTVMLKPFTLTVQDTQKVTMETKHRGDVDDDLEKAKKNIAVIQRQHSHRLSFAHSRWTLVKTQTGSTLFSLGASYGNSRSVLFWHPTNERAWNERVWADNGIYWNTHKVTSMSGAQSTIGSIAPHWIIEETNTLREPLTTTVALVQQELIREGCDKFALNSNLNGNPRDVDTLNHFWKEAAGLDARIWNVVPIDTVRHAVEEVTRLS